MKTCRNCGFTFTDDYTEDACNICGAPFFDEGVGNPIPASPLQYQGPDLSVYPDTPGQAAARRVGKSPWILLLALLMAGGLVLDLLRQSFSSASIIIAVFTGLLTIGVLGVFGASRSKSKPLGTAGLTLIQVMQTILFVLLCIGFVVVIGGLVLLYTMLGGMLDGGQTLLLFSGVAVALAVCLTWFLTLFGAISSIKDTIRNNEPGRKFCGFVGVLFLLRAVLTGVMPLVLYINSTLLSSGVSWFEDYIINAEVSTELQNALEQAVQALSNLHTELDALTIAGTVVSALVLVLAGVMLLRYARAVSGVLEETDAE